MQNLLIQNQLADFDGQTGNLVKQEISEENPASVTSSASGNMSVSGQNEEQTVIPQRDHEDDQNMVGQGSSDENILNQAAIQKALIQAVGVKNGNVISTSLIPSKCQLVTFSSLSSMIYQFNSWTLFLPFSNRAWRQFQNSYKRKLT